MVETVAFDRGGCFGGGRGDFGRGQFGGKKKDFDRERNRAENWQDKRTCYNYMVGHTRNMSSKLYDNTSQFGQFTYTAHVLKRPNQVPSNLKKKYLYQMKS